MEIDTTSTSDPTMNGTEVFEYSHIMVPPSMRSRYWQYFGFPCDNYNKIVTKKKIICTLCSTAITYNRNTTNLRTHLAAKHHQILHELDDDSKRIKTEKQPTNTTELKLQIQSITTLDELNTDEENGKRETTIFETLTEADIIENETDKINDGADCQSTCSSSIEIKPYKIQDLTNNTIAPKNVSDAVTNMLIRDLLPPSICSGSGFRNFVSTIAPTAELPSRKEIEKTIKTSHTTTFNSQLEKIKSHSNRQPFSICVDVWNNADDNQCANVYINYIPHDNNQQLQQFLFKTVCLKQDDNFDIFEDINLRNCSAVVVNCPVGIINEFFNAKGIPIVPCFASIIHKCMHQTFSSAQVKNVLRQLNEYLKEFESDDCKLGSDSSQIDDNFPLTKLNSLSSFYDKYSINTIYTSWAHITEFLEQIKEIIDCMTPLKVTLETLSDETVALCSLIKPFTTKLLNEYFCIYDEDSSVVASIKEIVNQVMSESVIHDSFLTMATFFDPRFLNFIDSNHIDLIKQQVKLKLHKDKDDDCPITEDNSKQNARKSSLKMFFQNDNDFKRTPKVVKNSYELEYQKYIGELCDMEQCPLTWWDAYGYIYRDLKSLAQNYICVPATVNDSFKKDVLEQINYCNNRQMIRTDCDRSVLFLHLNKISET